MPVVQELIPPPAVEHALRAFHSAPGLLLLDSARRLGTLGRYSFLSADPFAWEALPHAEHGRDPFTRLRETLAACPAERLPGLPPFQGGAAGMLAYELGGCWERLPSPRFDEFELPVLAVGLYDWVLAWDHEQGRAWIISQGWPEADSRQRLQRARERCEHVRAMFAESPAPSFPSSSLGTSSSRRSASPRATLWTRSTTTSRIGDASAPRLLRSSRGALCGAEEIPDRFPSDRAAITAPLHPLPLCPDVASNFTRDDYLAAVARVIEYIRAGDIYQANLSQRLLAPSSGDPLDLYLRLRTRNPAPFAAYFAAEDWAILSASPERFLQVRDGIVATRPIKGTRQRRSPPEADLFTQDELQVSEKDVAENVMIVDLLRNDLSRVCRPGSIGVPHLCRVETYETVHHLVSEVTGELAPGRDAWDLLAATFPGGSITGCPKVRAMEIIAELEQVARGPYCGTLFYYGFDGAFDSSILIRTLTQRRGWLQLPAGGGVIAPSDPAAEYEETLHKAAGMLRALHP